MVNGWTPGPWEVKHKRAVFPKGNETLAVATAEQHRAEAESNARLIAAAPELIAALIEIQTICREDNATFRKRMGTRVGNCLVVAEAAIAKARGEQ